jgi:hypothetical protein
VRELGPPWDDPDAEYEVVTDLLMPAAQARVERAMQDWDVLDTKALGVLAIDAAAIAGLVAVHESIHSLWWIAVLGFLTAGAIFIGSIWPREVEVGVDLVDFHNEMREANPLHAAREFFTDLSSSADDAEKQMRGKVGLFLFGLAVFAASLVICLPIVLFRP